MKTLASLLIAWLCAKAGAQEPARADLELKLTRAGAVLEGHGPSVGASYRVQQPGGIFVWAESEDFDPYLRVESADGKLQLANDNDGGGSTAWVRAPVEAGVELKIQVAGVGDAAAGSVRLRIREMPGSQASQAAKQELEAAFTEAMSFALDREFLAAREIVEPAVEALLAAPGVECNADAHGTLWRVSKQLHLWGGMQVSLKAFEALVRFGEGRYPPICRATLQPMSSVCGLLAELDRGEEAMPWCERTLLVAERAFGTGSHEGATARYNLGLALLAMRDLEGARDAIQRSVEDYQRLLGPDDVTTAQAECALGSALYQLGELDEARRAGEHALQALSKSLAPDDSLLLMAEANLAATLDALGDERAARAIHQRVLEAHSRHFAADGQEVLRARHNVAICTLRLGEFQQASAEFESLRECYRRLGQEATQDAETCELALADAYNKQGRHADALAALEARRRTRAEHGRSDAAGEWRLGSMSAQALQGLGEFERALQQAEHALAAALRSLPPENPDLAEARQLAARLNLKLGRQERAFELTRQAVSDAQGYFARCAMTLSIGQAEAAAAHWSRLVSDGLALLDATATAEQRAQADALAFELTESARGIGTALLRCSRANTSPGVEDLRRKLRGAAREVASVGASGQAAAALEAAIASKERNERELREALAGLIGPALAESRPSARDVLLDLEPGEALLAYWRVDARAIDAPQSTPRQARLCAFVLRAGQPVRRFDLGPLAPIAAAVQDWRAALAASEAGSGARETQAGERLRQLVLDPLRDSIGPAASWRLALDDVLHLIAVDALPLQGGRVGDGVSVCVCVTGATRGDVETATGGDGAFLALGGVDYDYEALGPAPERAAAAPLLAQAARGEAKPQTFAALWETQDEIDALASLHEEWRKSGAAAGSAAPGERQPASGPVVKLCDRDATKSALAAAAARAGAIHIATHGFFLSESAATNSAASALAERAPLALCGLALTGANADRDELRFEGLITAEELATLDLSRCRLVVLSACDTHVGTLSAGQGVASFQKALHAAGAQVVVTSLWKVGDESTRALMLDFYRGMWIEALTPEQALWHAKRQRIARRAPARDWAGWVLSRQ